MNGGNMITVSADAEMTTELLAELIQKHKQVCTERYNKLYNAYKGIYDINTQPPKGDGKPDNRIVVNFAKSLTDTMNGFFLGVPIRPISSDETVTKWINDYRKRNQQDDINSEIGKHSSIFGVGYEMLYVNENSEICSAYVTPTEGFMVYDDSVLHRPKFFIRYYKNADNEEVGSYSDDTIVMHFKDGVFTNDWKYHFFDGVPVIEYKENAEMLGLFETVLSIINSYNKAISEKANDVDYFSDAYLLLTGQELTEEDIANIRRNRVINMSGEDAEKYRAEFLAKPSADTTQENLLNRLEKLLYAISMVADINNEHFGAASGIAIRYRLWGMSSRAKDKERKFTASLFNRYKLIFSHPLCSLSDDAYKELKFHFTQNFPVNINDEANTARNLEGIVSKETQLSTLSIVDDISEEMKRIESEYQLDDIGFSQYEKPLIEEVVEGTEETDGEKQEILDRTRA